MNSTRKLGLLVFGVASAAGLALHGIRVRSHPVVAQARRAESSGNVGDDSRPATAAAAPRARKVAPRREPERHLATATASEPQRRSRFRMARPGAGGQEFGALPAREGTFGPIVGTAVQFGISPRASDLPPEKPGKVTGLAQSPENKMLPRTQKGDPSAKGIRDPVLQAFQPTPLMPSPTLSFDGLSYADNGAAGFGTTLSPPDTNGDVGPNHYVQTVNLLVRVYNKSGAAVTSPFKQSSLYAGLGGICSTNNNGDPIVLYDPLADRWMISQFAFAGNGTSPPYHQCMAVSTTPDPAGTYFVYDFITPDSNLNDYPHFGVWPDAYYMTDNQFFNGGSFNGAGAFAFDRTKMLAGDPTASYVYFDLNLLDPNLGGMLPSDLDGAPPPVGTPNYFAAFTSVLQGDSQDGMRFFAFHVDFGTPGNSTFTELTPVAVAAFDPRTVPLGTQRAVPQPGVSSSSYLDAIQDRLMYRMQYRNFGTYEALVTTHTVNALVNPSYKTGIRYYQFRRNIPSGNFTVNEQATFAPDADFRWMGSAATDHQGNLAVGYSVSSTGTFPSIRYAGRLAGDASGGLFQGEASLVAGSGVQTSTFNRWGDYSGLTVDPSDDCTFWYTTEYYTSASQAASAAGWLTRIGKFVFPGCTAASMGTISGTVRNATTLATINGATVQTTSGYSRVTAGAGTYSMLVPVGTYSMSASRAGYQTATNPSVIVTSGMTTTVNFNLTPVPLMSLSGTTLAAESCLPNNGVLDPGETVTMNVSLQNTGAADTSNLVATLQSSGGVTSPSGPQNYGVVPAGGSAVTRSFTFVVSGSCGATLTGTIHLQDGATDLGNVVFTRTLGALTSASVYTYAGPPVAIPDNNPTGVNVPLNVAGFTGNIADIDFAFLGSSCSAAAGSTTVGLNHTWVGDLVVTLTSPSATSVILMNRPGGVNNSGNNFCQTVLDDSAGTSIQSILVGGAPWSGSFTPNSPLSAFAGENPNGTWTLNVSDNFVGDTGSVRTFSLSIRSRACCTGAVTPGSTGNLMPDGRAIRTVIAAGSNDFRAPVTASRSYALDVDVPFNGAGTLSGGGPSPSVTITRVDGTTPLTTPPHVNPGCAAATKLRVTFTPSAADVAGGPLKVHITDAASTGYSARVRLVETSMYCPRWSSNGYNAYVNIQNTSDCTVSGNVLLYDSAGVQVDSIPFSLPALQATQILVPGGLSAIAGNAELLHDGPPGALTGGVYMVQSGGGGANFRWPFFETRAYGSSDGR